MGKGGEVKAFSLWEKVPEGRMRVCALVYQSEGLLTGYVLRKEEMSWVLVFVKNCLCPGLCLPCVHYTGFSGRGAHSPWIGMRRGHSAYQSIVCIIRMRHPIGGAFY